MTKTATLPAGALKDKCTECGDDAYRTQLDGPVSHSDSGEAECDLPDEAYGRVTISLDLHFIKADLDEGWAGKMEELAASCRAAVNEVIGDDGGAYQPNIVWTNKP